MAKDVTAFKAEMLRAGMHALEEHLANPPKMDPSGVVQCGREVIDPDGVIRQDPYLDGVFPGDEIEVAGFGKFVVKSVES